MTGHNLLAMMNLGSVAGGRRVLTIHHYHEGVKRWPFWQLFYRLAARKFQAITFPSDFIRLEAEAAYPPIASISHTVVDPFIIPPLPTAADRSNARRALGLPATAAVIGNAGWLVPGKRFDLFLRIGAAVSAQIGNAVLVVAGGGPEEPRLRSLAREIGVAERTYWLGWMQDIEPLYKSLDVLLFNSDADALGRTPIEALLYGVPVVTSVLRGGLREFVDQGRGGLVLDTHDVDLLTKSVVELLRHPEQARQAGLAGRRHLAKLTSVEHHAQHILDLI
jgi:glycosyltransferase involved in cell wall biosynthesis